MTVSASYSGTVDLRDLSKPVHLEFQQMQFQAERIPGEIRSTLTELVGSNIVGPTRITTSSRSLDVKLTDFTQALDVDLARGDITLQPTSLPLAKMNIKTRNGDVDLSLPEQAKFDLKGVTTHGDANNDWGDALKVESDKHGSMLSGIVGQGPLLILGTDRGGFTIRKLGEHKEAAERKEVTEQKETPEHKESQDHKVSADRKEASEAKKAPVAHDE